MVRTLSKSSQRLLTVLLSIVCFISEFAHAGIKVGLVLDKGGKDDKSFNSSAFAGATKAEKDLGITLKYVEAQDVNSLENIHRQFAKKNFDLVIGVGFSQTDAIRKVAAQFPQVKFALVDGEIPASNVKSLLFSEHEGSFLAGALAALKTKTQKVGFIGGMDIPLIRRFALGYCAGARHINAKVACQENFIGISGEAWNNPPKGKELALVQYNSGIDIIFVAAGASNAGVFDAAQETKKFAIGVDSNQNWMKPGSILTSMTKSIDLAVYNTIHDVQKNTFKSGPEYFGLKNQGVTLAFDEHNKSLLTPADLKKIEDLRNSIIAGKVAVPDYYKKK